MSTNKEARQRDGHEGEAQRVELARERADEARVQLVQLGGVGLRPVLLRQELLELQRQLVPQSTRARWLVIWERGGGAVGDARAVGGAPRSVLLSVERREVAVELAQRMGARGVELQVDPSRCVGGGSHGRRVMVIVAAARGREVHEEHGGGGGRCGSDEGATQQRRSRRERESDVAAPLTRSDAAHPPVPRPTTARPAPHSSNDWRLPMKRLLFTTEYKGHCLARLLVVEGE